LAINEYILTILAMLVSIVISIISLKFAYSANKQSKTANELAEEANKKSDISNDLAIEANELSKNANAYSKEANDLAKGESRRAYRPKLELKSLNLNPNGIHVYVGNNIKLSGAKPIKNIIPDTLPLFNADGEPIFIKYDSGYDYTNFIVRSRGRVFLTSFVPHKEDSTIMKRSDWREYLFINLCSANNIDNVILIFGLINLTIDTDSDNISELKIEKAYSMINENENVRNDMSVDVEFVDPKFPLTIPIAIAYQKKRNKKSEDDVRCALERFCYEIFRLKGKNEEPINLLEDKDMFEMFEKYIRLSELSCLLKCVTTGDDDESYYYTLMFRTMDSPYHNRYFTKIYGSKQFYKMAKKATERAGHNVIFKKVNK